MPRRRTFFRASIFVLLVSFSVLAGALTSPPSSQADHVPGMTAMSVDMKTAGNQATVLGPNDTCISVTAGAPVTFDVTALGIPVSAPMTAFGYALFYDQTALTVTASDASYLLGALQGSNAFNLSDPTPDEDGTFDASAADTEITAAESGSGILMRLTIDIAVAANSGQYSLTLGAAAHLDPTNHAYEPAELRNGTIAVGEACPSPFGDVDCSSSVNSVDALKVLRFAANLSVAQNDPCVLMGNPLPNGELQGDVDCSNLVNSVDALKLLRFGASLPVTQIGPEPDACPNIGT